AHEIKRRQHLVEFDRARFAVDFVQRQPHRDAHEKYLWQLDALVVDVQKVAIIERLQAEITELQIALGDERAPEPAEIELLQALVEQLRLDAVANEFREIFGVAGLHRVLGDVLAQHFSANRVQQQPRGDSGIGRILFDQRARGEDGAPLYFLG